MILKILFFFLICAFWWFAHKSGFFRSSLCEYLITSPDLFSIVQDVCQTLPLSTCHLPLSLENNTFGNVPQKTQTFAMNVLLYFASICHRTKDSQCWLLNKLFCFLCLYFDHHIICLEMSQEKPEGRGKKKHSPR